MGRQYVTNVRRYPPDLPLAGMDVSIGMIHLLSGSARTSSPAFTVAKQLAPLWVWGLAYLAVGLLLLHALVEQHHSRRSWAVGAVRTFGPALFVMWSAMYLLSALHDNRASFLGVPPYLYLAYRHHYAPAIATPAR